MSWHEAVRLFSAQPFTRDNTSRIGIHQPHHPESLAKRANNSICYALISQSPEDNILIAQRTPAAHPHTLRAGSALSAQLLHPVATGPTSTLLAIPISSFQKLNSLLSEARASH